MKLVDANELLIEWHQDPVRIARLIRFLAATDEAPRTLSGIADLVENAETWAPQYEAMCLMESA